MSSISTRQFKRLGFVKNATEFWWLAKLLIHVTTVTDLDQDPGGGIGYPEGGSSHQENRVVVAAATPFDDDMMYISSLLSLFCNHGSLRHR